MTTKNGNKQLPSTPETYHGNLEGGAPSASRPPHYLNISQTRRNAIRNAKRALRQRERGSAACTFEARSLAALRAKRDLLELIVSWRVPGGGGERLTETYGHGKAGVTRPLLLLLGDWAALVISEMSH